MPTTTAAGQEKPFPGNSGRCCSLLVCRSKKVFPWQFLSCSSRLVFLVVLLRWDHSAFCQSLSQPCRKYLSLACPLFSPYISFGRRKKARLILLVSVSQQSTPWRGSRPPQDFNRWVKRVVWKAVVPGGTKVAFRIQFRSYMIFFLSSPQHPAGLLMLAKGFLPGCITILEYLGSWLGSLLVKM